MNFFYFTTEPTRSRKTHTGLPRGPLFANSPVAWLDVVILWHRRNTSSMTWHGMAWHGHGMAWHGHGHGHGMAWHGMAWH